MISIRKDTIIRNNDHLIDPTGQAWEVKAIEGSRFTIAHTITKQQKIINKQQLSTAPVWTLEIGNKRNYW